MSIILRRLNVPSTQWICEWRPSWMAEAKWATTGHVMEATRFDTAMEAQAFAHRHGILPYVEMWEFTLKKCGS